MCVWPYKFVRQYGKARGVGGQQQTKNMGNLFVNCDRIPLDLYESAFMHSYQYIQPGLYEKKLEVYGYIRKTW